jgi:hypothetical protein
MSFLQGMKFLKARTECKKTEVDVLITANTVRGRGEWEVIATKVLFGGTKVILQIEECPLPKVLRPISRLVHYFCHGPQKGGGGHRELAIMAKLRVHCGSCAATRRYE